MQPAGTLNFKEFATGDEGYAAIRYDEQCVAILITLRHGGDLEFALSKEDAKQLLKALSVALS